MKLNCVFCGKLFTVSAEQLGGQGKCPHCQEVVFLPRSDEAEVPTESVSLTRVLSGHYVLAVLFAAVLHLLLIIALGLMVWGGDQGVFSSDGVRVKIGQPTDWQVETPVAEESSVAAVAPTLELEAWELQPALTPIPLSELSSMSPASVSAAATTNAQPMSTLVTGQDTLEASVSADFGALLEQMKRDGLDLVITFDSTGSMTGEINQVKRQIQRIGRRLVELIPETRISICTYRDVGDEYVVKGLPLTRNLDQVQLYLNGISAGGGGDEPEAVDRGLQWSIYENPFQPTARKVILIFGDAPPRDERLADCLRMAAEFRQRLGGVISTVTCRSPRRLTSFEQIAEYGGGEAFLTQDEREIVSQLVILVFGSQHEAEVLEAFRMQRP